MAKIQASYNQERLCLGERLPLNTPLSIIIDISERCNFKCNYCFRSTKTDESWGFTAKNELMTMDIFDLLVEQLANFPEKIKVISLSGHGEPLYNKHISKMARRLKGSNLVERIEMHTNASLLTNDSAIEIAQSGFSRIVVSLQGLDTSSYERVCGVKLNWNSFYNKLRLLYENKDEDLQIHIKISEAALNKNSYVEDEKRFYSLFGSIADSLFVEKVTPLWKNMEFNQDGTINKYGQSYSEIKYCPVLFYKIWVSPDGEIFPCTGLPVPMSLGNINKVSLHDAWKGTKRYEFLKEHLQQTRCKSSLCKDCFVPINTITSEKDIIDTYGKEILKRMEEQLNE